MDGIEDRISSLENQVGELNLIDWDRPGLTPRRLDELEDQVRVLMQTVDRLSFQLTELERRRRESFSF